MYKNIFIAFSLIVMILLSRSLYLTNRKLLHVKKEYFSEKSHCAKEMFDLARTPEKKILGLYQLMKDVDMVLRKENITYWAEGGTIIGAVRHKGIIPYDDDLDIQIHVSDEPKLESVFEKLSQLNYKCVGSNGWYQCHAKEPLFISDNHIDIFAMDFKSDNSFYTNEGAQKTWGANLPKKHEIYPVKEYDFGEFKIFGPNNPMPYMQGSYGLDVMEQACIYPQHYNSYIKKRRCVKLEGNMFDPAKPTGPLEDKSSLLEVKN